MDQGNFEHTYQKEKNLWGIKPTRIATAITDLKKHGNVLDIGVGEGRNALYLAQQGFSVTGIDVSETGVRRFIEQANTFKLNVEGIVSDICDYDYPKSFDVVLSVAILHFLSKDNIIKAINKAKEHTNDQGIHAHNVFTEENDNKNFPHLFKLGELKELYSDWKILGYKEMIGPIEVHGKNGKPHKHAFAVLLAQKN